MSDLESRALAHGIQPQYTGMNGEVHHAPRDTLEKLLAAFGAYPDGPGPLSEPPRLEARPGTRCHLPPDGQRSWGVALQLYQLRSGRNWGIGDFGDLEEMAGILGAAGADFVGLNPLHALFLANPRHNSPFSPSNRRFLNPLYIAVDRLPGFDPAMVDHDRIAALRQTDLVDYAAVAAVKLEALTQVWEQAGQPDAGEEMLSEGGADLRRHALFEAVSAHMVAQGHGAGWRGWPEDWQDADGDMVTRFAQTHAAGIRFHRWLQDIAHRQLAAARAACQRAGMSIGLYLDFAVGEASDGSGAWGNPLVISGVRIGAPPDYFNETGQDWGLAPLSPVQMAARKAAPFAGLMEQATRQAGALRIDHAMGLWQLFLIPDGGGAPEGTYARYPLPDMLDALARASRQNQTVIIGEDLGNVPAGFREVMDQVGILSYRILLFERNERGFIPPADYPRNALACLSTHDLPTFQGWWRGDDISLRLRHDLIAADSARQQSEDRETERAQLIGDLRRLELFGDPTPDTDSAPEALVAAVHAMLATSPSRLFAVRLEDLTGEVDPVNIPSTTDEHPNWQRKLGVPLERIADLPLFARVARDLSAERPRA